MTTLEKHILQDRVDHLNNSVITQYKNLQLIEETAKNLLIGKCIRIGNTRGKVLDISIELSLPNRWGYRVIFEGRETPVLDSRDHPLIIEE